MRSSTASINALQTARNWANRDKLNCDRSPHLQHDRFVFEPQTWCIQEVRSYTALPLVSVHSDMAR